MADPKDFRLLTPGPTPVPDFVRAAMLRALSLHHRHEPFRSIWQELVTRLPRLWQVPGPVVLLFGSGTAGMEALVRNLFQAGETVLIATIGKFGDRWIEIAQQAGLNPVVLRKPWGEAVHAAELADSIRQYPQASGLLMQACETSTGVENPLSELAPVLRDWTGLWVVDAITGLGSMAIDVERQGIDALVSASQKAWMLPPGLSMVWLSERAWRRAEAHPARPYYLDLVAHRDRQASSGPRFTPILPLVVGLHAVVQYLEGKGGLPWLVENARHLAAITRTWAAHMDLALLPREYPAAALTAIKLPTGTDGRAWVRFLAQRTGILVAGGQGPMAGRIFRINHLGYIDSMTLKACLDEMEAAWWEFQKMGPTQYNEQG